MSWPLLILVIIIINALPRFHSHNNNTDDDGARTRICVITGVAENVCMRNMCGVYWLLGSASGIVSTNGVNDNGRSDMESFRERTVDISATR